MVLDPSNVLPVAGITAFALIFGLIAVVRHRRIAEWSVAQRRGGQTDETAVRRSARSTLIAGIGFLLLGTLGTVLLVLNYLAR